LSKKPARPVPKVKPRRRDRSTAACARQVALIADYISGQMTPEQRDAFAAHLHACPDCAAFLQTYQKTVELTRSFLRVRSANERPISLTLRP